MSAEAAAFAIIVIGFRFELSVASGVVLHLDAALGAYLCAQRTADAGRVIGYRFFRAPRPGLVQESRVRLRD